MGERVKKATTFVKEKWTGFSTAVKIMIIAIPIAIIAVIIILAILLNRKSTTVLYSGLNATEQGQVSQIISNLGVEGVVVNSAGEIIVPAEQADYLRMQLAIQGFPGSTTSYKIWNDGVDLWSTDRDKREVARQQRESNIAATLCTLEAIQSAVVNLDLGENNTYALISKETPPTCSVTIKLKEGKDLTTSEVRAIYDLVTASVNGLTNDNVSLVDTKGRSYDWISEEEELLGERDASGTLVAQRRLNFQRAYQEALASGLDHMLTQMYGEGGYAINVSAILSYDNESSIKTEYFPSDDKNNSGVKDHEIHVGVAGALDNEGNLVGVTPNGDASPDYPTLIDIEDGQGYYYRKDEIQYDVTNIITQVESDGYKIEKLSVGVAINETNMTQTERELIESLVADAAGTSVENVTVYNTAFALSNKENGSSTTELIDKLSGIFTRKVDSYRDLLLFIVIALGALLILLFIVSLFMSSSRKKKIRRRQEQALAAAASGSFGGTIDADTPDEVDFNIASLTEEAGKDSRETILKREIADFAKNSPEIVASIIRNMLRDE